MEAVAVLYCGVCTLPVEFCEFTSTAAKCREWLEAEHPDVAAATYGPSVAAVADALSAASVGAFLLLQ
jgi:hypothetical protein